MPRSQIRRKVAALAIAGLCLAPWLSASENRSRPMDRRTSAVAESSRSVVTRLWASLVSLWAENGCRIDPNGLCSPALDTDGGSGSGLSTDNGCSVDPNGCLQELELDNGCRIDPNGCAK
jgi:hypothetical protein